MGIKIRVAELSFAALLVTLAISAADAPPAEPGRIPWTDAEKRTLESLSVESLRPPPYDPSNRKADDPLAARFGHRLFFDARLSPSGRISCASCHQPGSYFTDGLARSMGVGQTKRGAPTLIGAGYSPWLYWDGRRDSLWAQALAPMEAAEEMAGNRVQQLRFIAGQPEYRRSYEAIFGGLPSLSDRLRFPERASPLGTDAERKAWAGMSQADRTAVNRAFSNLGKALAAYQRLLIPGPSRFDRYVTAVQNGSRDASLTADEFAGLRLFLSSRAQCLRCHNGPLFSNHGFHNIGVPIPDGTLPDFGRRAAIREVLDDEFNCLGSYSDAQAEQCLELRFIKKEGEELPGAFKVPTLRNVAETAPYLHGGQFADLRGLLEHYSRPKPGVGHLELTPMQFTDDEMRQLEAFLGSLTSEVAAESKWLRAPGVPPT